MCMPTKRGALTNSQLGGGGAESLFFSLGPRSSGPSQRPLVCEIRCKVLNQFNELHGVL